MLVRKWDSYHIKLSLNNNLNNQTMESPEIGLNRCIPSKILLSHDEMMSRWPSGISFSWGRNDVTEQLGLASSWVVESELLLAFGHYARFYSVVGSYLDCDSKTMSTTTPPAQEPLADSAPMPLRSGLTPTTSEDRTLSSSYLSDLSYLLGTSSISASKIEGEILLFCFRNYHMWLIEGQVNLNISALKLLWILLFFSARS